MEITWLPVILAAVASSILGAIWYSPALFGKSWMHEMKLTREDMDAAKKKGMGKFYLANFIADIVTAYVLSWLLTIGAYPIAVGPWKFAALLWLGFVAPVMFGSVLWERRSGKLFFINAGYRLVALVVMALVIVSI